MWMWSLPFFDSPCRTAIHRQSAFPEDSPANPIRSTKSVAIRPHCSSVSCPSSARSEREQCQTSAATRLLPICSPEFLSNTFSWRVTSTPKKFLYSFNSAAIAAASARSRTLSPCIAMIAGSPAIKCCSVCSFARPSPAR
ncbi:hypothetical protein C5D04_10505 [Rathayibacter sp. AY1D2]|nr:hypothetical protein C5B93_15585 [Rathayibacter sp. AY1A2]PPI13233.1 hypothetical protein C5D04_10505 [Rathayibacter sp. AY1D2]